MVCVNAMRLLVAEADAALADVLLAKLQQESHSVQLISEASQLSGIRESPASDLVVLDTNVGAAGGNDAVFRAVQRRWPATAVIVLSQESSVEERVRVLNAGADDFLVKPFAVVELLARINAVLRRRLRPVHDVLVFEDLEVNRVSHEVRRAGHAIELSPKEYALLEYLLRNPGQPASRGDIIEQVWRMDGDSLTNVVDVYINYLRRKIDSGSGRPLIRTVRGVGYQIGGNHVSRG